MGKGLKSVSLRKFIEKHAEAANRQGATIVDLRPNGISADELVKACTLMGHRAEAITDRKVAIERKKA